MLASVAVFLLLLLLLLLPCIIWVPHLHRPKHALYAVPQIVAHQPALCRGHPAPVSIRLSAAAAAAIVHHLLPPHSLKQHAPHAVPQIVAHRAALPRGHPAHISSRLSAAAGFALDGQLDEAVAIVNTWVSPT